LYTVWPKRKIQILLQNLQHFPNIPFVNVEKEKKYALCQEMKKISQNKMSLPSPTPLSQ
jgi:hypothetical protein